MNQEIIEYISLIISELNNLVCGQVFNPVWTIQLIKS